MAHRKREEWKVRVFRTPSRRWWGLAGLVGSVAVIFYTLTPGGFFGLYGASPLIGVLEGMGLLFGSLAELMPEEQTTLAGVLRLWAILLAVGGFALMVVAATSGP